MLTEIGPVEIDVPRDVDASFAPEIVKKRQRRLTGTGEARPIRFTGRSRSGALVLVEDRGSSRNQLRDLSAEPFELRRIIAGQALKTPPCP